MELYDAINKRRTAREFLDKPVDFEAIKRILEAGNSAPTWNHNRNWSYSSIHDQGHLLLHLRYCRFVFTQGGGIQDIPLLFCQTGHGDIQECVCGKRQSERPGFSQRSGNAIYLDRISQSPGVMRRRSVLFLSRKACGQCGGGIVLCQPEARRTISA